MTYQVGLGERIGERTQAVLNVLSFPKREYKAITYREGISHNALSSVILDLNLLKIIWCHLSLFKILLWGTSQFLYLEMATIEKIYCVLSYSLSCYIQGSKKVICPYCSWLVWGLSSWFPGVSVSCWSLLNSAEGQVVHVQQFPLEPLPTEGLILLILRVSRNPTISESWLWPSIL